MIAKLSHRYRPRERQVLQHGSRRGRQLGVFLVPAVEPKVNSRKVASEGFSDVVGTAVSGTAGHVATFIAARSIVNPDVLRKPARAPAQGGRWRLSAPNWSI